MTTQLAQGTSGLGGGVAQLRDKARAAGFELHPGQLDAAEHLSRLIARCAASTADPSGAETAPGEGTAVDPESQGVFLWGQVGRGKSWLMDAFVDCLPRERTWRIHHHDLSRTYHRAVDARSGAPKAGVSAVDAALDDLIGERVVLCIDEFSVNDIGDGMLSYRLFSELFTRGVSLVVTSNYHPDQLLPHPIHHELYRPGIEQLKSELTVVEVVGEKDLRGGADGTQRPAGVGDVRAFRSAEAFRRSRFLRTGRAEGLDSAVRPSCIANDTDESGARVRIGNYEMTVAWHGSGVVRVGFDALCRAQRSTLDYLNLTDSFHTVVIDDVPRISAEPGAVRRRWISLIDVLYDRAVEVVLVSEHPLEEVLDTVAANRDTARTNSRLRLLSAGSARP